MSIPVIVGPAVTGTLMVMGGEASTPLQKMAGCSALGGAMLVLGMILFFGSFIERLIRRRGVEILSKLSGMVLAAVSAQMVLSGARPFFK